MAKFNEEAIEAAVNGAALKSAPDQIEEEQLQDVLVYGVPKKWLAAIKSMHAKNSGYMKQALREKLERDGVL